MTEKETRQRTLNAVAHERELTRWSTNFPAGKESRLSIYNDGACVPNIAIRRYENGVPTHHAWRVYLHEIDTMVAALVEAKIELMAEHMAHQRPVPEPAPMRANVHRSMRPERTRGRGAL